MYYDMQRWLPLELREMIYEYVLNDSCVGITPADITNWKFPDRANFISQTFFDHASNANLFDVFRHIHADDEATRNEMTKAWYKHTIFKFSNTNVARQFCQSDRWDPTTQPRSLVRRIEIPWRSEFWYYSRTDLLLGFSPKLRLTLVDIIQRPPGTEPFEGAGKEEFVTEDFGSSRGMKRSLKRLLDAGYHVTYRLESHVNENMIPSTFPATGLVDGLVGSPDREPRLTVEESATR